MVAKLFKVRIIVIIIIIIYYFHLLFVGVFVRFKFFHTLVRQFSPIMFGDALQFLHGFVYLSCRNQPPHGLWNDPTNKRISFVKDNWLGW